MRVGVAGAGIGGLACALALRARGVEVVVLERAADLGEAGAGVQLGPNAVRVLDGLALGEAMRRVAFTPEAAEVRSAATGRLLLRTPLGEAAERRWGAPYLQLHRSDLQALLREAAQAAGVEVQLGREVLTASPAGELVTVDGAEAFDAVVGADGLRSPMAASLFSEEAPRFTGQVAWRAVVAREAVTAHVPPVAAVWTARGAHLVHYPVRAGREVNVVAVVEGDWREEGWRAPGDPAALSLAFAGWPEPVPQLLAAVTQAWRWALYDRPPRPRWSIGRATLLGDAAHPMLPFLAQGAATAIEDAQALAAHLAGPGDVEAALTAYEAERRPRTARVQAWSRRNATLFHLPEPLARTAFAAGRLSGMASAQLDALYGYSRD